MGRLTRLLQHRRRNQEILEEAHMVQIAMVGTRRRLEWSGHLNRGEEPENIGAVYKKLRLIRLPKERPRM